MFVFLDFKIDSHCVQISCLFFLDFEMDSHCVTPVGLKFSIKFSIILPQFTGLGLQASPATHTGGGISGCAGPAALLEW